MVSVSLYFFAYFWAIAEFIVFLPKLLLDNGYTPWQIGILFSIAPLMKFFSPFVFLSRFTLTPKIFIFALWTTVLGALAQFGVAHHFENYLFVMLIWGFVWSLHLPFIDERALYVLGKESYGKARLFGSLGFLVAVLLLGAYPLGLYDSLGSLTLSLFIAALCGTFFARRYGARGAKEKNTLPNDTLPLFRKEWGFWGATILMQLGFGAYYSFFTVYTGEQGLSLSTISWLWSFGVICEILMLYFQRPFLRFNLLRLMQIALFATAFRWGIIALFPTHTLLLFIVQALHALSFALFHTASLAWLFERYPQNRLAGQFYYGLTYGLGGFIGSLLFGLLYGPYLFLYAAFFTLIAAFMLIIYEKSMGS